MLLKAPGALEQGIVIVVAWISPNILERFMIWDCGNVDGHLKVETNFSRGTQTIAKAE